MSLAVYPIRGLCHIWCFVASRVLFVLSAGAAVVLPASKFSLRTLLQAVTFYECLATADETYVPSSHFSSSSHSFCLCRVCDQDLPTYPKNSCILLIINNVKCVGNIYTFLSIMRTARKVLILFCETIVVIYIYSFLVIVG